jgi:hypothetical protein
VSELFEHERLLAARRSEHAPSFAPPAVERGLARAGRPLNRETREYFEPKFGHSFADVRVHDDQETAAASRTVGAAAYSVGRHIAFASGRYEPHTAAGRRLLGHELAHVVQQRAARLSDDGLRISDPGDAREAAAAGAARRTPGPVLGAVSEQLVQRQLDPAWQQPSTPPAARGPVQPAGPAEVAEHQDALRQFSREKSEWEAERARRRILAASSAMARQARAVLAAPEDERAALREVAHGLQKELAVALRVGVTALEKYVSDLESRRASGEPVAAEIATARREIEEHRSDLATMGGIFSPARGAAFEQVYKTQMPGMFCMVRAYEGLGALFSEAESEAIQKKVAKKAAREKKRSGRNIDHFITVMNTVSAEKMAGPRMRARWRRKGRRWEPTLEQLVRPRVSGKVPGYYFFGLALAEAFHSVIVGVSTWQERPLTVWCDQYGCAPVAGTLDEHALAALEHWESAGAISYTDWDTYLWQILPPPEASAVASPEATE